MDYILTHINPDLLKMLLAIALGGAIGLEREVSNKVAGLRTNILICVGATLFTVVSFKFYGVHDAHIPAQIIAGIGFLGAGAIMRVDGEHITGLTTAATIWIVAAIGVTLGHGYFALAGAVTLMVLFVQLAFTPLDILINDWQERHTFRVVSKCDEQGYQAICKVFEQSGLDILRRKLMKKNNAFYSEWFTSGARAKQEKVMRELVSHDEVLEVTY